MPRSLKSALSFRLELPDGKGFVSCTYPVEIPAGWTVEEAAKKFLAYALNWKSFSGGLDNA